METMSGLRHVTVSIAEVGASCVIADKNADIHGHMQTIIQERISILTANPVFFRQLLLAGKGRLPVLKRSLRLSLSTGNQLSPNLKNTWKETTGIPLYNYYGLTETTGICIAESPGFTSEEKNSIGLPVDCLVKILDESGDEVQKGLQGELCVYGAGIFNGYYKNDDATKNSLVNGWFHTKDLAIRNEDGSLSLCGRFSDIVKLPSGERVEIAAIEEVMEKVFQLNDWAVCSLKEEEKESIAIFIVPDVTANLEKLLKNIKEVIGKAIGSYAVPSLIEPVTHIPRGNHNKVLRKKLTDSYFQSIKK
jgi:acyl-coenzyme A synthetase/AMP-(fatty) acid ligase